MAHRFYAAAVLWFVAMGAGAESISYTRDVQPILTEKCVACHACYDSPCQLNLGSAEGVSRGASKTPVYDGARTRGTDTTRLFLDAHGPLAWQRKGFYSVLDAQTGQAALMARMLELGEQNALEPNARLPDSIKLGVDRPNACPLPGEFDTYAKTHPQEGMPLGVTGLTPVERQTLKDWLAAGAPLDPQALVANDIELAQVKQWEDLLNAPGARESLVARWLYEHLFLAHLYFQNGDNRHFFQAVRSRTPSGTPVDTIASRRPNDDPGTTFYYRLIPVQGVIVHKTHITYPLSPQKLARVKELFYSGDWQVTASPGYGPQRRANPFETFAAIPARARYQFMLENAEYFVQTFIRGPVCRGQIATDVIRDNFWVMFQDPDHDLYITDPNYRGQVTDKLALPGQLDDLGATLSLWRAYRDKRNDYEEARRDAYADAPPPSWSHIWAGNDNAVLSIFRHFDSATVKKGLIGEVPQTLWWMDYPLLERTYYQLVVNFDVYGNVSHQAQTRLYFDLIRNGAEENFLRLMPPDSRDAILDDWYQNSGKLKMWMDYQNIDTDSPTGLQLPAGEAKNVFARQLVERYAGFDMRPDPINRCVDGACYRRNLPKAQQDAEQALSRLTNKPGAGLKVIQHLPEATMVRVEEGGGTIDFYSVLRNRAHSNVAFMMGESLRWQPGLDTLTVYPGVMSSYPNFMFTMQVAQVPAFVAAMEQVRDSAAFEQLVRQWGVRRTHPEFWRYFHDLDRYIQRTEPVEAGILDMNRYENL